MRAPNRDFPARASGQSRRSPGKSGSGRSGFQIGNKDSEMRFEFSCDFWHNHFKIAGKERVLLWKTHKGKRAIGI
ncbi:MAG: hypothetical protein LUG15_01865, partial [Oscillospiraceae bacterium]|nr:hypothetical protein [Oscillospiraceae bacterium]